MERIKTSIKGFDELVDGGFPKGSTILLSGTPGTGKTIFSLQYLYNGALDGEVGIYFSFEEKKESLIEQAKQFGFDLASLEKKKKLKIISIGTDNISKNTLSDMLEIIKSTKAKRVVVDSITTLSYIVPEISEQIGVSSHYIKRFLYSFITNFKNDSNLTSLFISQKEETKVDATARYLCDGVLSVEYESLGGDFSRNLTIPKMRKTKNDEDLHPVEINSKEGIVIHNL